MDYERKVAFAIKLLQSIPTDEGPIEVSYSGGKDSDVILELAKMAGIPFEAIYKTRVLQTDTGLDGDREGRGGEDRLQKPVQGRRVPEQARALALADDGPRGAA